MKIWRDFSAIPQQACGGVVALGNFDGLHLGHRAVLDEARALAQSLGAPLAVMTFEPHPRRLFNPQLPVLKIVSLAERIRLLEDYGVEQIFLQRFTRDFAATPAKGFIEDLLIRRLGVAGVVTGESFLFGHQRGGNAAMLASYTKNFTYRPVAPANWEGEICSSTRIREALRAGNVEAAGAMLTRPYAISGIVRHGDKRGREWGFPTANICPGRVFLPRFGIYSGQLSVLLPSEQARGGEAVGFGAALAPFKKYDAVMSFGIRPMYRLDSPLLEVHALDASPDLYGKKVRVEMLHFLRPEAAFTDEAALRAQIARDCDAARALLAAQH